MDFRLFGRKRRRLLDKLIWIALTGAVIIPVALAALSPFLAYRDPVYIVAGFAGILTLSLFLMQPLLAAGLLPNLSRRAQRRLHPAIGGLLAIGAFVHVGGLYLTSPPDTLDALLLRSPTPFSVFGVAALGLMVVIAGLVLFRSRLHRLKASWLAIHHFLVAALVVATVIHAVQINGAMEPISKGILCLTLIALVGFVTVKFRLKRRSF